MPSKKEESTSEEESSNEEETKIDVKVPAKKGNMILFLVDHITLKITHVITFVLELLIKLVRKNKIYWNYTNWSRDSLCSTLWFVVSGLAFEYWW